MKSLPVIAVVVLATATLSLTSVPLAAGSAIPIKRTTLHVRDVSEADSRAPRELRGEQSTLIKRVHHELLSNTVATFRCLSYNVSNGAWLRSIVSYDLIRHYEQQIEPLTHNAIRLTFFIPACHLMHLHFLCI